jgi:AbrB family looped-hinge helix DNA binding protein
VKRIFATVGSEGQLVIPAALRDELGILPGTRVALHLEDTRLILEPGTLAAKLRRIYEIRGCTVGHGSGTELLLEDRRRERERELAEEGW